MSVVFENRGTKRSVHFGTRSLTYWELGPCKTDFKYQYGHFVVRLKSLAYTLYIYIYICVVLGLEDSHVPSFGLLLHTGLQLPVGLSTLDPASGLKDPKQRVRAPQDLLPLSSDTLHSRVPRCPDLTKELLGCPGGF